jgi:chemotaxis protein histidine kinase CheA
MTVPAPLIEFFQQEAAEYLERLDQVLSTPDHGVPDAASFVAQARALRGSAMMTRLDGLSELCATVERIANGLRNGELRWDQRLLFAVRGALVEIRALVSLAPKWGETEQRRSRTQSVALAAVAAGYLAGGALPSMSPASAVVPVSRLLMDDGSPPVLYRNPEPSISIAQRFRGDVAASASGVAREAAALVTSAPGGAQLAVGDGVRRALLGLSDVADSYGATSISGLATRMARVSLDQPATRTAIQSFARLLMDRELTDQELAAQVRSASASWNSMHGTPSTAMTPPQMQPRVPSQPHAQDAAEVQRHAHRHAQPPVKPTTSSATPSTPVVPIDSLVYSGESAMDASLRVRDKLREAVRRDGVTIGEIRELVHELSDLLDLASRTSQAGAIA